MLKKVISPKFILGFVISVLLLYLTFHSFNPQVIGGILKDLSWKHLIAAVLVFLVCDIFFGINEVEFSVKLF